MLPLLIQESVMLLSLPLHLRLYLCMSLAENEVRTWLGVKWIWLSLKTHQKHITFRSMPSSPGYLTLIKDRKMRNLFHVVCHWLHVLIQDEFEKKIPALFISLEIFGWVRDCYYDFIVDKHVIAVPSADREPWSLAEGTLRGWSPNRQILRV